MMVCPLRIFAWFVPLLLLTVSAAAQDNLPIYADRLENGWKDYSGGITETTSTTVVHSGTASTGVTMQGFGVYYLYHYSFNPQLFKDLVFWVNGGSSGRPESHRAGGIERLGTGGGHDSRADGQYVAESQHPAFLAGRRLE